MSSNQSSPRSPQQQQQQQTRKQPMSMKRSPSSSSATSPRGASQPKSRPPPRYAEESNIQTRKPSNPASDIVRREKETVPRRIGSSNSSPRRSGDNIAVNDNDAITADKYNNNNLPTSSSGEEKQPPQSLNSAETFRLVERAVRRDGNRAAYFGMSFLNSVLSQPPRRPEVVRKRRYDASLSLMDVIRGAADSTERLQAQWPLEYPLFTLDAVRRKATIHHLQSADEQQQQGGSSSRSRRKRSNSASRRRKMAMRKNPLLRANNESYNDDINSDDDNDEDDDGDDGYDELAAYKRDVLGVKSENNNNNRSSSSGKKKQRHNNSKGNPHGDISPAAVAAAAAAAASGTSSGSDFDNNSDSSNHPPSSPTSKQKIRIEYSMRAMTSLRIPLMRLGVPPVLLHFWGLLDPSDPLKDGWSFLPASDTQGANEEIYKNAFDHAGLNLFIDWPAKTFLNNDLDLLMEEQNASNPTNSNNNNNNNSNKCSSDEGPALLQGITITAPSNSLLADCRENYFGSNTKPGDTKATANRSAQVASMILEQCERRLDVPLNIEYVIKSAFSEWSVAWRAKRQLWRSAMNSAVVDGGFGDDGAHSGMMGMSNNDGVSTSYNNNSTTDPDLAAAAVAVSEQNRKNPVNPLLELEGYAQQTAKILSAHATAAGQQKKKKVPQTAAQKFAADNRGKSGSNKNDGRGNNNNNNDENDDNNNNNDPTSPSNSVSLGQNNSAAQQQQQSFAGVFENSYATFVQSQNSLVSNDVDTNPFISLTAFICARLRGLVEKCMACQTPLIRNVVRPSTCGLELCNYSSTRYGTDFLTRLQRGSGAVAEFLILCGINAVATQREMLMPMCDIVVSDDGLTWQLSEEQTQASRRQHTSVVSPKSIHNRAADATAKNDANNIVSASPTSPLSPTSPTAAAIMAGQSSSPPSPTGGGTGRPSPLSLNAMSSSSSGGLGLNNNNSPGGGISPSNSANAATGGIFGLAQQATQAASTPKSRQHQKRRNDSDDDHSSSSSSSDNNNGSKNNSRSCSVRSRSSNRNDDDNNDDDDDQHQQQSRSPNHNRRNNKDRKPAAQHFYKKDEDVGTGTNKNISLLIHTLNHLPSVPRLLALTRQLSQRYSGIQVEKFLMKFISREACIGMAGGALTNETGRALAGPFLKWLFSSLPGELALLPKTHLIPRAKSEIQFLVIGSDPEREARFQALKQRELERRKLAISAANKNRSFLQNFSEEKDEVQLYPDAKNDPFISGTKTRGSFFAWHGSGPQNWHSILRNGLRNMSHTHMMTTGALHGGGIYASRSMHIAMSYSLQPVAGWTKASVIPHSTGISVISLCEIVDWNGVSVRAPDPRLQPQFRKQQNLKNQTPSQPTDPVQIHADGQIVTVLHDDYIMPRVLIVYTDRTPKHMDAFELEIPEPLMTFIENQYNVV